jgi:hypothetical protein
MKEIFRLISYSIGIGSGRSFGNTAGATFGVGLGVGGFVGCLVGKPQVGNLVGSGVLRCGCGKVGGGVDVQVG